MRKYLILFLVLITVLYTVFERYLILTACETYSLKIHKGSLYLRYDILVNEMSDTKSLGKIYACRRYKTIEPDIFVKSMLEEYTNYKKINKIIKFLEITKMVSIFLFKRNFVGEKALY